MKAHPLPRVAALALVFLLVFSNSLLAQERMLSERLWVHIQPAYRNILMHPFLTGLANGTLPEKKFNRYILQNYLYLKNYSKALAVLATRAPVESWSRHFLKDALKCSEDADDMIAELKKHGVSEEEIRNATPSPVCLAYSSYEMSVVQTGTFEEGLAALLPCYIIYYRAASDLPQGKNINPRYREWFSYNSDAAYKKGLDETVRIFDEATRGLPESRIQRIQDDFCISARFEQTFWDSSWRDLDPERY